MSERTVGISSYPRIRWPWWIMMVLSALIALYGLAYVILGPRMYPPNLMASFLARPWGIYPHAFFGSIPLLIGPWQFRRNVLAKHRATHRKLGQIYVIACLLVGLAGFYMSFYAGTNWIPKAGFACLAVTLIVCTYNAYAKARARRFAEHREWMILSYACILAAVTLRIELPLLIIFTHEPDLSYGIVAWACWVPNLAVAAIFLRRTRERSFAALSAVN
ncbi:MAG TPA: DUF2306 domain-containing protein [Steroidobacteraceae bacterium]|nr:DUF2306 domain-containing protein [Steroidobacteraceae bacterium]